MIPQGDLDLTGHLNELLRRNEPERQNKTFWFPTSENLEEPEDHTPIQTRILKELIELNDKEKLNRQEITESRNKCLKRFNWTNTLLTETEKQAYEDFVVDYLDIFARHRMNVETYTEFKMKLTPRDDIAVYSQNLPMPIRLKEDLIVEMALMHKYGIIAVVNFASRTFAYKRLAQGLSRSVSAFSSCMREYLDTVLEAD